MADVDQVDALLVDEDVVSGLDPDAAGTGGAGARALAAGAAGGARGRLGAGAGGGAAGLAGGALAGGGLDGGAGSAGGDADGDAAPVGGAVLEAADQWRRGRQEAGAVATGAVVADEPAGVVAGVGVGAEGLADGAVPGVGDVVVVGLAAAALGDDHEVHAGEAAEHAHDDGLAGPEEAVDGVPAEVGALTALDAAGGAEGSLGPDDGVGAGSQAGVEVGRGHGGAVVVEEHGGGGEGAAAGADGDGDSLQEKVATDGVVMV